MLDGRVTAIAQVGVIGTPDECIAAIEEYKAAGCTHVMLELWGEDRLRQIELFGREVLPRFRDTG